MHSSIRKSTLFVVFSVLLLMAGLSWISFRAQAAQTIIYVDGSRETDPSQNRYKTITEAIDAVPVVSREEDRVIIEIADGTYREQLRISKPYLTLRSASSDPTKVVLTWYYGIGYVYNNIGPDGFYDPNVDWSADATWDGLTRYNIGDRVSSITYYDKNGTLHKNRTVKGGVLGKPDRWGCAVKLERSAREFIAENITFESSFNFYITQEELDAGVTPEPQDNPKPARAVLAVCSTEVEKQNYTERAAALHTDSDHTIIRNCIIRSKQDTLYVGSGRILFDNCTIMGGTDYIFGGATAVFNQCDLVFAGYTDGGKTGTITAGSHGQTTKYGFLFWNCIVDYRLKDQTPTPGTLGRPWSSALGAQVTYIGTTIKSVNNRSLINDEAWGDMGSTMRNEARFYEYGSIDENGEPINTSWRVVNRLAPMGSVLTEWQSLEFNPYNYLRGSDGWDPLGLAPMYAEIHQLLDAAVVDTNTGGRTAALPEAPEGYAFAWVSDSEYAVISEDGTAMDLIRPAYGEQAADTAVTLFVKDLATGYGDKEEVQVPIAAWVTADNSFDLAGTVYLKPAAAKPVKVEMVFFQRDAVVKKAAVEVPVGQTKVDYAIKHLPEGDYQVAISAAEGYIVVSGEAVTLAAKAGEKQSLDVTAAILKPVALETADFVEAWAAPTVISPQEGFEVARITGTGAETANLGAGNTVYRFSKDEGVALPENAGAYWDLAAAVKANGGTLEATETLRFSFDFLLETVDYLPSNYSYFDLAASLGNQGAGKADPTRFIRWGVHGSWSQLNMFGATNSRVNGHNSDFHAKDEMANKWFRIVADIDLKNQVITTTLYNRDANRIINGSAFTITAPDAAGVSKAYPAEADLTEGLYFVIYIDNKETPHKMEYYFDNFRLEYQDYAGNW
ncbi:MAG TPA: pectinesterase family protein [Limnochordia bacterium]|nr:pectinesterase family protein [Limnochordia bacterium]